MLTQQEGRELDMQITRRPLLFELLNFLTEISEIIHPAVTTDPFSNIELLKRKVGKQNAREMFGLRTVSRVSAANDQPPPPALFK